MWRARARREQTAVAERRIWNWADGSQFRVVESKVKFLPLKYYAQRQVEGRWENISTHRKELTAKAAVEQVIIAAGGTVPQLPNMEGKPGMLVLTRKKGQRLILQTSDGPVELVNRSAGSIKLALAMPDAVRCLRAEVDDRKSAEGQPEVQEGQR